MLEKTEARRRIQQQRMKWLDSITDSMDMSVSKLQDREVWHSVVLGSQRVSYSLVTEQQLQGHL